MSEPARITVEMARCFNDRREALSLIHSAHVRAGLPSKSENALRVTRHQLLPRSRIFVAKAGGKVVSTLSLMPDSPAGLPLDDRCPGQVDRLRARGLHVAEVGCFADRRQERGKSMGNFCSLLRFVAQYAVVQGIDSLVIAGQRRRARFLKNYLGFKEELTTERSESLASDAPAAVVLLLEFERLKLESPQTYQAYFGQSVPPGDFAGGFMPRWEADYFGRPCAIESSSSLDFSVDCPRFSVASPTFAPTLMISEAPVQ